MRLGKTDSDYLKQGIALFEKRLWHYISFNIEIIPDLKKNKKYTRNEQKEKEGELILKRIKDNEEIIILDENGKEYNSGNFSTYLEKKMINGTKNVVFIIGGPYGFSQKIHERTKSKIALSKMTFSHQMVRLIFIEQLYRAMTIIRGEPYHHI